MTKDESIFRPIHTLLKKKQYEKALKLIYEKKSNRIRRPYVIDGNHAWYIIGDIFYKKKRLAESIMAFRRSIRCYKGDAEAAWALGNSYSALNRPRLAERYFRKGLGLALENDRPKLIYNLGNTLFDQGKYSAAINMYRKLEKRDGSEFFLAKKKY